MTNHIRSSTKLAIFFTVISDHSLLFLIPTVIVYLVEHVSEDKDPKMIAYKVGIQEGLSRILGSLGIIVWASASDKIGRKYSLFITMTGITITSFATGLSSTYNTLLFWRTLSGFFLGTIPILKAAISDLSDNSNISVLYSYFGSGYGVASICGPLLGGLLSHPYRLNSIFDTEFFHDYPYFLPFFIKYYLHSSCFSTFSLIFVMLKVPFKHQEYKPNSSYSPLRSNQGFIIITIVYLLHAFVQFSYRTLISLWVKSDTSSGGIGWKTETNLGVVGALSGIIVALVPLILTNKFSKRFSKRNSIIILEFLHIPFLIIVSCSNLLNGVSLWIVLILCHGFIYAFITMATSFISICVTNSVPETVVGRALGITQAIASFSRSISAIFTANIFGVLVEEGYSFPLDSHLLFIINCFVLLVNAWVVKSLLSNSIDLRYQEAEKLTNDESLENQVKNKSIQ